MRMLLRMIVAGVALFAVTSASAEDRASPAEAKALLTRAVEKIRSDGPDVAFAAFDDPKGGFKVKELYVFAFDLEGKYKASGANPKLVGTDAIDVRDAEGTPVVREIVGIGKGKGQGVVKYLWLNRVTNMVERKKSFVQRVGDYVLGVGFYQN